MKRQFFSQQSTTTAQRNFSPPPSIVKTYSTGLNFCDPHVHASMRLVKKIKSAWTWSLHTRAARSPAVRMYTHFGEHTQPARSLYVSARGTLSHFQAKLCRPWLLGYQTNHFNLEPSRLQTLRFAQACDQPGIQRLCERSQDVLGSFMRNWTALALFESKSALLSQSKSVWLLKVHRTTYANARTEVFMWHAGKIRSCIPQIWPLCFLTRDLSLLPR